MRRSGLAAIAAAAIVCSGAGPGTWRHPEGRAPDDNAENVSLAENGWILLAPQAKELVPGEAKSASPSVLWTGVVDLKGNLFAGGADARVLRLDRKGLAESFFEGDAVGARALAADVSGNLYVATFPAGRVYRIGAAGRPEVWFEPEERYLWAMAMDAFDRLYVASGERGVVYQVTGRGEGRPFFDSDEPHITALAADPTGRLLAGSAGRGLLYRLDAEGRAEVLLDSRTDEISAIAAASDGTVFAAGLNATGPARPRRAAERPTDYMIEVTPAEDDLLEEAVGQRRKLVIDLSELLPAAEAGPARPAARVFKIPPGRTAASVWSSPTEQVYALGQDSGGNLLVGTGPAARLYRLEPDGSATLVRRWPAAQITAIVAAPEGATYVLTSNPGRIHVLEASPASSGRYLSPVHDAGTIAWWGSLRWEADVPPGTRIEIRARSGNGHLPDETWSAWSEPYADPRGSAVRLPSARYVQWRADLSRIKTGTTPVLKQVVLTYLPENLSPAVRNVSVSEPGAPPPRAAAAAGAGSAAPPGAQGAAAPAAAAAPPAEKPPSERPATYWATWTSSDANGDPIEHTVSIRRADESEWRVLARGVKETAYEIDPSSLPEARYLVRVEADDAAANGAERALRAEARSDLFFVDRTPPLIEPGRPEESDGGILVTFQVRDASGIVARAEWAAAEDGPWTPAAPKDGLADTGTEAFSLRLPTTAPPRRIFLRAADATGNMTTLEVDLSKPR